MAALNSQQADAIRGRALRVRTQVITPSEAINHAKGAAQAVGCLLLALSCAPAQSGPTLVGFGPLPTNFLAPGDIVTLRVAGLKTVLPRPVKAAGPPLPTTLAGISVALNQYNPRAGPSTSAAMPIPLLAIEQQADLCDDGSGTPECTITSITAQIPFWLDAPPPSETLAAVTTELVISENGVSSKPFFAVPNTVDIHILSAPLEDACYLNGSVCPAVTHPDGTLVTAASPAQPGEVVVIYATGLGITDPAVPAGQATLVPAPVALKCCSVQFDFSPNARPKSPSANQGAAPRPEFVGLSPGQVGLYQINVRIPDTIPPVLPCKSTNGFFGVFSNLTITVDTFNTYYGGINLDGAAICVAPPQ